MYVIGAIPGGFLMVLIGSEIKSIASDASGPRSSFLQSRFYPQNRDPTIFDRGRPTSIEGHQPRLKVSDRSMETSNGQKITPTRFGDALFQKLNAHTNLMRSTKTHHGLRRRSKRGLLPPRTPRDRSRSIRSTKLHIKTFQSASTMVSRRPQGRRYRRRN